MGGVAKAVEKVVTAVERTVENIIKNPLPVIETIALTAVTGNPALSAAAVSAANGGDIKQIATAYIATSAGQMASEAAVGDVKIPTETTKILSSAAGASAQTVTAALASGQPLDKALEAGLTSGALAGGTTGVIEEAKSALAPPETGQGIKAIPSTAPVGMVDKYSVLPDYSVLNPSQEAVSGLGLTEKVPTGGGQGLVVDPANVLFSSQFAPSTGKVRGTEEGGLQPAYKSASDYLTPPSFDPSLAPPTPYQEPKTVTQTPEPVISKTTEAIARPLISSGLSEIFGLGPKVPGAPSAGSSGGAGPVAQGTATGTTVGLTGERGAGEIESKETGKARQNVWNEASLRLKDALGV
jgi:hypothetical protein